ncbi:hypothetical protein AYO21_04051 [Fonsecaea monophora]|uniref:Uncharacterized protein n=1 Tax=Fonsecaea monophora TaxID=254056 RepID=A0A177FDK6_9EURO|nr:hypothetical protein AYO21_04051 [Fonsecaea monophora]OAG41816.1 hypothetical protein AYO21_04051 [Fonsecaea monophora]
MTRGIIFLGVPHKGTRFAYVAACLACTAFFRGSSTELLEFMFPGTRGPAELESAFYDYIRRADIPPSVHDVWEKRPERMGRFSFGSIVGPIETQPRHGDLEFMDTDHRGLIKFRSHDDPNFRILLDVLRTIKQHAMEEVGKIPSTYLPIDEPEVEVESILDVTSLGMPFLYPPMGTIEAAGFYGLQDLVSARLTRSTTMELDFASRVVNFAFITIKCAWITGAYIAQAVWLNSWNFNWKIPGLEIDCTDEAYRGAVVAYLSYATQYDAAAYGGLYTGETNYGKEEDVIMPVHIRQEMGLGDDVVVQEHLEKLSNSVKETAV